LTDNQNQAIPSVSIFEKLEQIVPEVIKDLINPVLRLFIPKYSAELAYWKVKHRLENHRFINIHYRELMLAMAGQPDDNFLKGKTVTDFGCGPRGSLAWVTSARQKIGIDVLVDKYSDAFSTDILSHDMVYLKSTEKIIPLPSESVDVLFTINAMDHVKHFELMCAEILRIMKPGALFFGSFNIGEPKAPCEPQKLSESMIKQQLLDRLTLESYQMTLPGDAGEPYKPFLEKNFSDQSVKKGMLWIRARKPLSAG